MTRAIYMFLVPIFCGCGANAEAPSPDMPMHTAHAGCLEVGVERARANVPRNEVPLSLVFQNDCGVPLDVDLRKLKVIATTDLDHEAMQPIDTRIEIHPGRLAPGQRATELLAYGPVAVDTSRICIDPSEADVDHIQHPAGIVCLDVR
jgi:hypothetical protein